MEDTNTAWLAYPILIRPDAGFSRREFQIFLENHNIQTRVVFTGNINRQPGFKDIEKRVRSEGYPNADHIMKYGVLLPVHHGISDEMFEKFQQVIMLFIKNI